MITLHTASITVERGETTYASLDDRWDMLNQKELFSDVDPDSVILRDESDIQGIVTEIENVGNEEVKGRILVELEQPNNTSDKFWVTIEISTPIYKYDGREQTNIEFNALNVRQTVEVWFKGAVAESYPAQVTAKQIIIRPSLEEATILEDPEWVLESYGEPGNLKAVLEGTEITARFNRDEGLIKGSSGCNNYVGAYTISGNNLSITEIEATEIGCLSPEGIMEQETHYLGILLNSETFKIDDNTLRIKADSQSLVFTKTGLGQVPVAGTVLEFSCDSFSESNNISLSFSPEIEINDFISVVLCSNPTSGFQWSESAEIIDNTIISQVDHYYSPPESEDTVGAAGTETWTFKGLKKGITNISMEYSQPWEGGQKGLWTFDITVFVN